MVVTEVFSANVAPPAVPAGQIVVDIDAVPRPEVPDIRPTLHHISAYFVADNPWQLVAHAAVARTPAVPVPHQRQSQPAGPHPHKGLGGAWLRPWDFFQKKRTTWFFQD
jgi:hypothetical protein